MINLKGDNLLGSTFHALRQQIDYRHAHSNTVFDLIENDALVAVGYVAGDFYSAVDGARVHDNDFLGKAVEQ